MKSSDISHVISLWKPSNQMKLDASLIGLCHSEFFRQYQLFTQQYLAIFDHTTMMYQYISENIGTEMGCPREAMMSEGIKAITHLYHPEDIDKLIAISSMMNERLKTLSVKEVLECRLTFDYRMLAGDGQYRRLLQHNIPLTVDDNRSIGHVLILATDISSYKKQNYSGYKIVHYKTGIPTVLMEGKIPTSPDRLVSRRELDVIRLIADGFTEKGMASQLSLSIDTIKTHRKNLLRKAGVKKSTELVRWAMANLYL